MIPVGKRAMNNGCLKIKQNAVESNLRDYTLKTYKGMLEYMLYYPYTLVFKKIDFCRHKSRILPFSNSYVPYNLGMKKMHFIGDDLHLPNRNW